MNRVGKRKNIEVFVHFLRHMVVIMTVPAVLLFFFSLYLNGKLKENAYEQYKKILEYSARDIEQVFQTLDNVVTYFYNESSILNFYYLADPSRDGATTSTLRKAQESVRAMEIANDNLLYTQLYAEKPEILVDCITGSIYLERYYGGVFDIQGNSFSQWKKEFLNNKDSYSYSSARVKFYGGIKDALIYNRKFAPQGYSNSNNRIIFYLDKEVLMNCFETLPYKNGGFICILNENGEMLLEKNSGTVNLETWQFRESSQGYYVEKTEGVDLFITRVHNKMRGWDYVAAIPLSEVNGMVEHIIDNTVQILLMAAFVAIMLMILMAYHLSKPVSAALELLNTKEQDVTYDEFLKEITKLVMDNTELNHQLELQIPVIRTGAFCSLLMGKQETPQEKREILKRSAVRQDANYYVVLVLICNDIDSEVDLGNITAQKVLIEAAFKEQESDDIQGYYQLDYERMVILLTMDDQSQQLVKNRVEIITAKAMEAIKKNIHFSISVGGDITDDVMCLSEAFYHANTVLEISENVFGQTVVQWYDMLSLETVQQETFEDNEGLASKIKAFLDNHYMDPQISLGLIASEFCVTESYISKLFKREIGQNFSKYIEQLRVTEGKKLIDEGISVNVTAQKVGYNSAHVFRRAWKRYYGTTPLERKENEDM